MTLPVLETSRHDAKPLELYRFGIEPEAIETSDEVLWFQDAMSYLDLPAAEAAGWGITQHPSVPITWDPSGVLFNIIDDGNDIAGYSYIRKTVPVPAGARVACEFNWSADGHWFEPLSLTLTSGGSSVTKGAQPIAGDGVITGTSRTGFITVGPEAEVRIDIAVLPGYPNIAHDDEFIVSLVRLLVIEDGESFELPTITYHYARAERLVTFLGDDYVPTAINRSPFRSGDGESSERVEFRIPRDHELAQLFQSGGPVAPVTVTVYHVHRQDLAAGDSFTTPFVGQVGQAVFQGAECVLTLESLRSMLQYKSPTMLVQMKCANFLYDRQCGLNRETFKFTTVVNTINGFALSIEGLAASAGTDITKFELGFIIAPSGEHLFIEKQDGDTVFLISPPQHLAVGESVKVYWGCDRTPAICHTRFGNIQHHNGRGLMPRRNNWSGAGMTT